MSQPAGASLDSFVCVRCGATVPVAATACPACGLELYPAEDSTEGETRCRVCGAAMSVDDRVCPRCSAEVIVAEIPRVDDADADEDVEYICSVCGGEVAEDDVVCPHCGADVEEIEDEPDTLSTTPGTLRQAQRASPGPDEEIVYTCSVCGGDVAEDDVTCPHCGADVSELEEATDEPAEPGEAEPWPVALTARELVFVREADRLPEDCVNSLTALPGEKLVIPAREPKVGDIIIRFAYAYVVVSVGGHVEGRFPDAHEAVDFIDDVVNDRVVFRMEGDEVEVYRSDELGDEDERDWSYYVWSGPLRNKRTGIDWYRP